MGLVWSSRPPSARGLARGTAFPDVRRDRRLERAPVLGEPQAERVQRVADRFPRLQVADERRHLVGHVEGRLRTAVVGVGTGQRVAPVAGDQPAQRVVGRERLRQAERHVAVQQRLRPADALGGGTRVLWPGCRGRWSASRRRRASC